VSHAAADQLRQRGSGPELRPLCEGTAEFNSIWGNGIIDALAAVTPGAGGDEDGG
jgi:hypothetical protein